MDKPFTFRIDLPEARLSSYDEHIVRRLSDMEGQYLDTAAYASLLAGEDVLLYDVYANIRPRDSGELLHGLSVLHPGKVGDEYFRHGSRQVDNS